MRPFSSGGTVRCGSRGLFGAPKELSVSRPTSLVPPVLFLSRPMPCRGRPIPFSVERVVAQQLESCFWQEQTSAEGISANRANVFLYHRSIRPWLVVDEEIGEVFDVNR